jgi:hypothetical protein
VSQKLFLVVHLMMDSEHRWTPLLDSPTALLERRGRTLVWEARTDFGIVGVYPRAILRKSDKFSQGFSHPGLDPPP